MVRVLSIGRVRARATALLAAAGAILVLAVAGCGGQANLEHGLRRQSSAQGQYAPAVVRLAIDPKARTTPIPESFLGLSTEYWTLPVDERHFSLYRRVISLLHVPGDGPFVLRVGGDSSDRTLYDPEVLRFPRWVFELTHEYVARTARAVHELGLRVILDLNLITATPQRAAAWADEAQRVMPAGSIIGYEIGNEPDLYSRLFWLSQTDGDRFGGPLLPHAITPDTYAADYRAYARVLAPIAPGVPVLAPALANPRHSLDFIRTLLATPHPGLRVLSGHRYPYSGCAFPGSAQFPTISRVLGDPATTGMAQSVQPLVALARGAGLAARLTEFNSVTCGGLSDVSNTFATALWAPDAIFELMRTGLAGVNLHARQTTINGPFTFDIRGLRARPLLYGLIMFARTLGPDARLVTLQRQIPSSVPLKAWAVRVAGNRLHVLLINKGPRATTARLRIPASARATLQRLLAPSPSARNGLTLAGQSLDENVTWRGVPQIQTVVPQAQGYVVTVLPYSATLLSVPLSRASRR